MPIGIIIKRTGKPLTRIAEHLYQVHYEGWRRTVANDLWRCLLDECPKQPENKYSKNRLYNWLLRNKERCTIFKQARLTRIVEINLSAAPNIYFIINRCKPHIIKPRQKSCLHFLHEGRTFFIYSQVNHPGKKANNFIYRAARRYAARYLSKLSRIPR